jgi:hypothetical protein
MASLPRNKLTSTSNQRERAEPWGFSQLSDLETSETKGEPKSLLGVLVGWQRIGYGFSPFVLFEE